jgi:hypothetical protein
MNQLDERIKKAKKEKPTLFSRDDFIRKRFFVHPKKKFTTLLQRELMLYLLYLFVYICINTCINFELFISTVQRLYYNPDIENQFYRR